MNQNKFKTLRRKDTKEFVRYELGFIHISKYPQIMGTEATMQILKNYHDTYSYYKDVINWDNYEIVNVEIKIIE